MHKHSSRRSRRGLALPSLLLAIVFTALLPIGCDDGGGTSSQQQSPTEEVTVTAGAGSASWIIEQLTNGLEDYVDDQCAGWILSIVGLGPADPSQELKDAINAMNQKLNTIISELGVISGELTEILQDIKLSMDIIVNYEQQLAIKNPQDIINNTFINLTAFQSSEIGTDTGKASAQDMADDITNTARSNIDQQIYNIYSGVLGLTTQGKGVLDSLTTTLVDKAGDGKLLGRYQALQTYYKSLLQVQLKGANMMVEALHYRDDPPRALEGSGLSPLASIQPNNYPGTAKQWMEDKFMPMLTDEVQEFLRCAERLVLAECDLRTDASGISKAFLPDDAETIFSQADFLAAQIAPSRYTFGLVVRLIGEPDTINAISEQYQIQANNQAMQAVPLLDATDVRLVPVELWNHWPDEAKPKYLQWNWDTYSDGSGHSTTGFLQYTLSDQIAVALYTLDSATTGVSYAVNTTFPNEYATADVTTALLDGDMNPVKADAAAGDDPKPSYVWGHVTLPIRHIQGGAVWYEEATAGYNENDNVALNPRTGTRPGIRPPFIDLTMYTGKCPNDNNPYDDCYDSAKTWASIGFGIKTSGNASMLSAWVQLNYDMNSDFSSAQNKSKLSAYWLMADAVKISETSWSAHSSGYHQTDQQVIGNLPFPAASLILKATFELHDIDAMQNEQADLSVTPSNIWLFVTAAAQ